MNNKKEPATNDWPDPKLYPQSIRVHFSLYVAGMILALMLTTSLIVSNKHTDVVTKAVVEGLLGQTRSYGATAGKHLLASNGPDVLMLNSICRRLSDESETTYWAAITDSDNRLVAHTDVRQITSTRTLAYWEGSNELDLLRPGEAYLVSSDKIRIRVPIMEQTLTVGHLEVSASAEPIRAARWQSLMTMGSITLAILILGLPLTMFLTHRKLSPVSIIAEHLRNTKLGDLDIDIPIQNRNEFGYLADTLRVMGQKLNEAQTQAVEQERMERELEIAREIQAKILPRVYPSGSRFESAGFYQSAKEVGGDYFDFVEIGGNRLGIVVADVSGKSLPGMLIMLLTRDIVRQAAQRITNPGELLKHVNHELRPNIKRGMFVTMFYGILDCNTGTLEFSSAGHNPLLHVSGDTIREHRPKGFPLGLMPPEQFDQRIESAKIHLNEGDSVVQYSDGINEAQNDDGDEFGMERFKISLEKNRTKPVNQLVAAMLKGHNEFVGSADQYDDITLVAIKWIAGVADIQKRTDESARYESQH